jgi:hypothetical protein
MYNYYFIIIGGRAFESTDDKHWPTGTHWSVMLVGLTMGPDKKMRTKKNAYIIMLSCLRFTPFFSSSNSELIQKTSGSVGRCLVWLPLSHPCLIRWPWTWLLCYVFCYLAPDAKRYLRNTVYRIALKSNVVLLQMLARFFVQQVEKHCMTLHP